MISVHTLSVYTVVATAIERVVWVKWKFAVWLLDSHISVNLSVEEEYYVMTQITAVHVKERYISASLFKYEIISYILHVGLEKWRIIQHCYFLAFWIKIYRKMRGLISLRTYWMEFVLL